MIYGSCPSLLNNCGFLDICFGLQWGPLTSVLREKQVNHTEAVGIVYLAQERIILRHFFSLIFSDRNLQAELYAFENASLFHKLSVYFSCGDGT